MAMAAHNLARLLISIYPFSPLEKNKEKLTVLVRYVFRDAAGVDYPFFSTEAKEAFKSALVDIGEAIEKTGGKQCPPSWRKVC